MFIKIGDYSPLMDSHKIIFDDILKIVIDDYSSYKEYHLSQSDLYIDHSNGLIYCDYQSGLDKLFETVFSLTYKFPETLIFLNVGLCEEIEHWTGSINWSSEMFFGIFLNGKCSCFFLNHRFHQFQVHALCEYYSYRDNFAGLGLISNLNEFINLDELYEKIKNKNLSSDKRYESFGDFVKSDEFEYYLIDDYNIVYEEYTKDDSNRGYHYYKWKYSYFDYEPYKYNTISVLDNELEKNYIHLELFENQFLNRKDKKYTIVIDTETNGLPSNNVDSFPFLKLT